MLRPLWPLFVVAAVAFLLMSLMANPGMGTHAHGVRAPHDEVGVVGPGADVHAHVGSGARPSGAAPDVPIIVEALTALTWWAVMVLAMMLPTAAPSLHQLSRQVPRHLRLPAAAAFVTAFVAAWSFGVVGLLLMRGINPSPTLGATALLTAAWWELTPLKLRALKQCRRHPVVRCAVPAVFTGAAFAGAQRVRWCVLTCGPAMIGVLLAGHPLWLVAGVTFVLFTQGVLVPGDVYRKESAWSFVALAVLVLVIG